MGRWRPKGSPASKYITVEGYHKLNDELQYLWKEKRPVVTQAGVEQTVGPQLKGFAGEGPGILGPALPVTGH